MSTEQSQEQYKSPLLQTTCRYPQNSWQMDQKSEMAPSVLSQYAPVITAYKYDAKGHLIESDMRT